LDFLLLFGSGGRVAVEYRGCLGGAFVKKVVSLSLDTPSPNQIGSLEGDGPLLPVREPPANVASHDGDDKDGCRVSADDIQIVRHLLPDLLQGNPQCQTDAADNHDVNQAPSDMEMVIDRIEHENQNRQLS
jgi:hypothetical protein